MRNNLKNRPKEAHIGGHRPAYDRMEIDEWFEGFEKELREIREKRTWLYAEYLAKEILGE
jgi:hypothetical protein